MPVQAGKIAYLKGADRPALSLWLLDDTGALIDFSSGYTFSFKLGRPGQAAALTKTTGIVGAVGSGVEPTGVPNVVVTWAAGDLDIAPMSYTWQLTCTTGGLARRFQGSFLVQDIVT